MGTELSKELVYFKSQKETWLKSYAGKYALIKEESLIGTFDSMEDAYKVAIDKFGNSPVLIKKISAEEEKPEELPALMIGVITSYI